MELSLFFNLQKFYKFQIACHDLAFLNAFYLCQSVKIRGLIIWLQPKAAQGSSVAQNQICFYPHKPYTAKDILHRTHRFRDYCQTSFNTRKTFSPTTFAISASE